MKCKVCGEELKENQTICPNCGSMIEAVETCDSNSDNNSEKINGNMSKVTDLTLVKARELYAKGKWKEASEQYEETMMNNPNSIEALLFNGLALLQHAIKGKRINEIKAVNRIIKDRISYISEKHEKGNCDNEYVYMSFYDEIKKISDKVWIDYNDEIYDDGGENLIVPEREFIDAIYETNKETPEIYFSKILLKYTSGKHDVQFNNGFQSSEGNTNIGGKSLTDIYNEALQVVSKEDSQYLSNNNFTAPKQQHCYIATAVYGSYDCPEVWVLRRYRDYNLASSWGGRLFIKIYYAISPTFIRIFGKTRIFNEFWKEKLDSWVKELKNKGYEDTKYYD